MKTNSILSLLLLLCIILCGCTHDSQLPADGTTDAVTETDTASETAEPQEAETYEITYRIEKVFEDFNYGKPVEVEGLAVTMMLPKDIISDHIIHNYQNDNPANYVKYREKFGAYTRCFEFDITGKVAPDFVMNESIFAFHKAAGPTFLADYDYFEHGTSSSGNNYLIFENLSDDSFSMLVFFRLTDEHIIKIAYSDDIEDRCNIYEILNSIKVK